MGEATKHALAIGEPAPVFEALPAVDGRRLGLKDFNDKKVLVVFFSCNHCPYVQAYEDRIMQLQSEFGPQGVQFVAINSNDAIAYPEDSFTAMVARAKERAFNFVSLRDEAQTVAKAFRASHTPHLFVFDKERKLAYTGRIDDNWQKPEAVTTPYLKNALAALVAGRVPSVSQTFAIGCTIKWKNG